VKAVPALLGLVLVTASCSRGPEPVEAPGSPVVLVSIDTLRSDRVGAYGYTGGTTPRLDRLATESVLFERAYSHYPLTLPSHASLFTGLLPPEHGVRDNRGFRLAEERVTLAERLRDAGYATLGAVSSMVLRHETGIAQGFDAYDDQMGPPRSSGHRFAERRGEDTLDAIAARLDELLPDCPFFVMLHLFDPHAPYEAPEPFARRHDDRYDAEVAYADDLLGRFLDELRRRGLYDRSLIVVLSDHGEGLGDHVEMEHGLLLYREALQVPLLIKAPGGARAGERVAAPVGLIDVVPTILAVLGLPEGDLPGRPLLQAEVAPAGRPVYSETYFTRYQYGWSELRSIIRNDNHYIEAPRPELYDLVRDPEERTNLHSDRVVPPSLLDALEEVGRGTESRSALSAEESANLAALGYVGGAPANSGGQRLPDPKDHIADAEELASIVRGGRDDGPVPNDGRVRDLLFRLAGGNEPLHRAAASRLWAEGRDRLAFEILEPFAGSPQLETQLLLGKLATNLGHGPEARDAFRRAVALDGERADVQLAMGTLLMTEGRPAEAFPWIERALELDPGSAEAWNSLGVLRAGSNDLPSARAAWERAVAADPALGDAWFNLALARRALGEREGAVEALLRYAEVSTGPERVRAFELLRELGWSGTPPSTR
jgi:arylsulfatase A-like enzyme